MEDRPIRSVTIGQFAVSEGRCSLAIHGLGSCVGLILFDPKLGRGGLAHVLLPGKPPDWDHTTDLPAKYGEAALDALLSGLSVSGVRIGSLRAALIGGAKMFESEMDLDQGIGKRNAESLRRLLGARGIQVAAQETGGTQGRTVIFELPDCRLRIRTLRGGWSEAALK